MLVRSRLRPHDNFTLGYCYPNGLHLSLATENLLKEVLSPNNISELTLGMPKVLKLFLSANMAIADVLCKLKEKNL